MNLLEKKDVFIGDSAIVKLKNGSAIEGVIKGVNFESMLMYNDLYGKKDVVYFDDIEGMELL